MKLLIVKTSSLGDIVQARESLAALPAAEVHWVVEKPFSELVEGRAQKTLVVETKKWRKNPFKWLSEIRSFISKLRETQYDVIIDLQGNLKSSLILAFARGKKKVGFGFKSAPEKISTLFTHLRFDPPPNQNVRLDYLFLLEKALGFKGAIVYPTKPEVYKHVLVCPGSAWKNKQLSLPDLLHHLEAFHEKHPCTFHFLWATPAEKAIADQLQAHFPLSQQTPKLSLKELEALMARMDLVIAMDSFPLHLAGSLGIPTFAFFGSSQASKYNPLGPQARFIQGPCPYGRTFAKRCPVLRTCPTGACMKPLTRDSCEKSFAQ